MNGSYLTKPVLHRCALVFRGCKPTIPDDHILCPEHWNALPEETKSAYWATPPHSDRRRGELLKLLRVAFDQNPKPEATEQ